MRGWLTAGLLVALVVPATASTWIPSPEFWKLLQRMVPGRKALPSRVVGKLPPVNRSGIKVPGYRPVGDVEKIDGAKVVAPTDAAPSPSPTASDTKPIEVQEAKRKTAGETWFESNIVRRVTLTGERRIGFHSHRVSGDREAYDSLNYYGQGGQTFTDTGTMNVSGKNVLGFLTFDMTYSDNEFNDPDAQRVTLNYNRGPYNISAGDIRGSLFNTNPFAPFSKSLKGVMGEVRSSRTAFRAIHSETKGNARTVSLPGTNSAGPYFLQSGRLIPDTLEVQVDGQTMRLLDDYVVNGDMGAITFVSRIIPPTSTIVVTYESYSTGAQGTVQAAGLTYNLGRAGRIGLTGMQQLTGTRGSGDTVVQRFYGFGSAAAQYWLDYEPDLTRPFRVKVDGIEQVRNVDYTFDPSSNYVLYFTRAIGTTQQIDVIFYPKNANSVDGDRQVWGLDYRLPIGRRGFVQYSQATGALLSDSNPMRGTARGIDGQVNVGNITFRGNVKDIPRDYVTVQSIGFQRNERASELGFDWRSGRTTFSSSMRNSSIATRTQSGNETTDSVARYTRAQAGLTYSDAKNTSWSLTHNRVRSRETEDARIDTTSLSGTRSFGRLDTNIGVEMQNAYGLIDNGTSKQLGSVDLQTFRLGTKYRIGEALTFDARASTSRIKALGQDGNGTDYSVGVGYRPGDRFAINATYADSDSGALATLGNSFGGDGIGYGGNGFSGGTIGSGAFSTGASRYRSASIVSTWQVAQKLGLDFRIARSESSGTLSSNSRSLVFGLGVDYDLGNFTQLSVSLDRTNTEFLSLAGQASGTTSLDLSLNGAPKGPWNYRIGVSQFLSGGGTSDYDQDAFSIDGLLGYRLTPRQRIGVQLRSGKTTGFYGQNERLASAFYEYRLWANLGLIGSYRVRDVNNLNAVNGGAYRSSGFDLELVFDFSRY